MIHHVKRLTILPALLVLLALLFVPVAASAAARSSWPIVRTTIVPYFDMQNKDELPSAVIVNPPAGGCANERPGSIALTLRYDGERSIGHLVPCGNLSRLPKLAGLVLRRVPPKDAAAGGIEIGLMPLLSHSNYAHTISLSVTMAGRTLLEQNVRVSMLWDTGARVWEGTDDFINICIDESHTVYSSNLHLYCVIPSTLLGEVRLGPRIK